MIRIVEKLPADSRASILTAGLLGDNYIGLQPGFEETEFLKDGGLISAQNTDSALQLENLVSKFMSGQASKPRAQTEKNATPNASPEVVKPSENIKSNKP